MMDTKAKQKIPAYLRFQNFKITHSLMGKMALFTSDVQEMLAFIQSLVLYNTRKKPIHYANISSKVFKEKNRHYRRYMAMLVNLGELDINEAYIFSEDKSYTKSYRVPKAALDTGFTTFGVKRKRIRASKDTTTATTKGIIHQQKCFRELRVRDSFISTGEVGKDTKAKRALLKVSHGCANIRRGKKTNRQYNTILQIPANARCNLVHKDGAELAEFDFGTCHPFLLLNFCTPEEKTRYADFITGHDIYSHVMEQMGKTIERAKCKNYFLKFLNGGRKNLFDDYFIKNFPALHTWVRAGGKSNAKTFQDLEASIMETLEDYSADNGLYFIREHDGWLGKVCEGKRLSDKLVEIVKARIGVNPTIKITLLTSPDKDKDKDKDNNRAYEKLSILVHKELTVQPMTSLLPSQDDIAADMKRTIEAFKAQRQQTDVLDSLFEEVKPEKLPEYRGKTGKLLPYHVRVSIFEARQKKYQELHDCLNSMPNLNSK
jgi:hypothetical protein